MQLTCLLKSQAKSSTQGFHFVFIFTQQHQVVVPWNEMNVCPRNQGVCHFLLRGWFFPSEAWSPREENGSGLVDSTQMDDLMFRSSAAEIVSLSTLWTLVKYALAEYSLFFFLHLFCNTKALHFFFFLTLTTPGRLVNSFQFNGSGRGPVLSRCHIACIHLVYCCMSTHRITKGTF